MSEISSPVALANKPFEREEDEVAYWDKQFKTCEALRRAYEEQWYMNLAFYFSKQWVTWNRLANGQTKLISPATPRNRVRLTANRIKAIIRDELTKLIKEEPHFYVQPNTTDLKDVAASRVGESIAEYILHTKKYNRVRRQATFWALITGTGFIKTLCAGDDQDIELDRVPSFHIYVCDLDNEEIQTQPYIIHARGISAEVLEEKYQYKGASDMNISGVSLEQKFLNALGIKNNEGEYQGKLIFTKEIWVKPNSRYPNGALLVIANNKVIYRYSPTGVQTDENNNPVGQGMDDFPYEHGQYPFAKIDHTATGRFYGESTIVDEIPLQKEYNRTRSQIIESKNRMAKPQMTYVKGSIDPSKVTSEVGLMIPVQPGFDPPRPIVIEPLPEYVLGEVERIKQDMDEIAGRNEISRGSVPTGVEAASAIAYLKEENDSKIYNTVASIEDATEEVGKQVLELVQQFWSEEKIVNIVSKNNVYEAQLFKVSSLNGNTDFRIEAGSMAPKSMAAKQAFIVDLMKNGLIPPEKGFRYLEMNETKRFYEELQVDSRHAQRENMRMAQGMPAILDEANPTGTNAWDDDETHVYEHKLYMKTQEYEMLPPEIQNEFKLHLVAHLDKLAGIANVGNAQPGNNGDSNSSVSAEQQYANAGA